MVVQCNQVVDRMYEDEANRIADVASVARLRAHLQLRRDNGLRNQSVVPGATNQLLQQAADARSQIRGDAVARLAQAMGGVNGPGGYDTGRD